MSPLSCTYFTPLEALAKVGRWCQGQTGIDHHMYEAAGGLCCRRCGCLIPWDDVQVIKEETYPCPHCGQTRSRGFTCETPDCPGAHNDPDGP